MSGSTVDREIRISATDSGVFDKLSKMKEGALAMGRGIAEETRKQATSSRELIKLMNDEIALIEKKNKLNDDSRRMQARDAFSEPNQKKDLSKALEKIQIESKEDKLQTDILKQILQATLKTSKEEISADRESVKRQISSDKEIDTMEDHEQALKQTFSKQLIQDSEPIPGEDEEQTKKRAKSDRATMGNFVKDQDYYTTAYQGAGDFLTSRSKKVENKFGSRLLAMGGIIAGTAAMGVGAATDYYESLGDMQRLTGLSKGAVGAKYDSLDDGLDLTNAQAIKRGAQLMQASGGKTTHAGELNWMMAMERGYGIDATTLAKTEAMATGSYNRGITAFGMGKGVLDARGMNNARLPDVLQLQQELVEQQFMATGEGDVAGNTGIINRILSGQTKEGRSVARARGTLNNLGGIIQGGNEQLEAIRFSEFQKKNGGGYLDFLEEKEKGVSGTVDDIMIDSIIKGKGSDDDKIMSMVSMGMGVAESRDILRAGGVSSKDEGTLKKNAFGIAQDAANETKQGDRGINDVTYASAVVTNGFNEVGVAAVELVKTLTSATRSLMSSGSDDGGSTINSDAVQKINPSGFRSKPNAGGTRPDGS